MITHGESPKRTHLPDVAWEFQLLLIVLLVTVFCGCATAQKSGTVPASRKSQRIPSPQEPSTSPQESNSSLLPTQERKILAITPEAWALATTAILATHNKQRHDLLAGGERTADNIQRWQHLLTQWWEVHNRAELLAALQRLERHGHRRAFQELATQWMAATKEQQEQMRIAAAPDEQKIQRLTVVAKYAATLGRKSLLGWDATRYIMLCRWGYGVGYLTEKEAWQHIMPTARRLQSTFQSWADLGENYLIGRMFWSAANTKRNGPEYQAIYYSLLQNPTSPWTQCPWNLSLGGPTSTVVVTSK